MLFHKRIDFRINNGQVEKDDHQISDFSELEDKMLKITSEEQNKVKRMKRTEDSLRDLCCCCCC